MKREIGGGRPVAELENIHLSFGGLQGAAGCERGVESRAKARDHRTEGAGKSSLFNIISGIYTPSSGTIRHKGEGAPVAHETLRGRSAWHCPDLSEHRAVLRHDRLDTS